MTPYRVLLVDDDRQIRTFLHAILTAHSHCVFQAADGVEALDVLDTMNGDADLLITDIKMPRMDGVTLARRIAQLCPELPVLFVSGWSDALDEPEWQKPGYAFLRKPFLPKALFDSIDGLMSRTLNVSAVHG